MVCKVSISNGEAHFCSKFVNSEHRKEEAKHRKFLFPGQMGTRDENKFRDTLGAFKSLATGQKSDLVFRNPSNTNAFYWGGKVRFFLFVFFLVLFFYLKPLYKNTELMIIRF